MKKINQWATGTVIGVISVAIVVVFITDWKKGESFLTTIKFTCSWLYSHTVALLTYPIKLWIVCAVLVGLLLIYRWYKFVITQDKKLPNYIDYKEDILKRWIWRWSWKFVNNDWRVTNLTPYCPKDDVQLIQCGDFFTSKYYCPKCNAKFGEYNEPLESPVEAEVLLLHKINKGTYPRQQAS